MGIGSAGVQLHPRLDEVRLGDAGRGLVGCGRVRRAKDGIILMVGHGRVRRGKTGEGVVRSGLARKGKEV